MSNTSDSTVPAAPPSIGGLTAGGDAILGSNVDQRQAGGLRFGAGARITGPVAERIINNIYNYGVSARTPGAAGQPAAGSQPPSDEDFARHYLRHYILGEFAHLRLPMAGLVPAPASPAGDAVPGPAAQPRAVPEKIDLLQAFVPSDLAPVGGRREPPDRPGVHAPRSGSPVGAPPPTNRLGPLVESHSRVLILGTPGVGQSLLFHHLAVLNARAWLAFHELPEGVDPDRPPAGAALEDLTLNDQQAWREWVALRNQLWTALGWTRPRYPMLVSMRVMRSVENWLASSDQQGVDLQALLDHDADALGFAGCPAGFFFRWLQQGNTVLMFDDFSDVDGLAERERTTALIGMLLADVQQDGNPDQLANRVVISADLHNYEGELNALRFAAYRVSPLTAAGQAAMVRQYYQAFALAAAQAAGGPHARPSPDLLNQHDQLAADLAAQLGLPLNGPAAPPTRPGLAGLAASPLLLGVLVATHYAGYGLPARRDGIYLAYSQRQAAIWERPGEEAGLLQPEDKLGLMRGLALRAQLKRSGPATKTARILLPDALRYVADTLNDDLAVRYGNRMPADADECRDFCEKEARAWLAGLDKIRGLIRGAGIERHAQTPSLVLEFGDPTVHAYLAAEELSRTGTSHPVPRILARARKASWQDVVISYLLLQSTNDGVVAAVVSALLREPGAPGLRLLGRVMADPDLRPYITPAQQEAILTRLETVLWSPKKGPAALEPPAAAAALALMADLVPAAGDLLDRLMADARPGARARVATALRGIAEEQRLLPAYLPRLCRLAFDPVGHDPSLEVRMAAAGTVAVLGDPRLPPPPPAALKVPPLAQIDPTPPGGFLPGLTTAERDRMLSQLPEEYHYTKMDLEWWMQVETPGAETAAERPGFEMSVYPVTNVEYARYVGEGGRAPEYWHEDLYHPDQANHPVVDVTWDDAIQYCAWLTERLHDGFLYRLPGEAEWEWAARGPERRLWPWGDTWRSPDYAGDESLLDEAVAVGLFPGGTSWCGVQDLAGNVWEWTGTVYDAAAGRALEALEVADVDDADDPNLSAAICFDGPYSFSRAGRIMRDFSAPNLGFRIVRVPA